MSNENTIVIFVVDDDEDLLSLVEPAFTEVFPEESFKFYSYLDGQELLEALEDVRPDLILLDLNMPDVDGWEALKTIKESEELKSVLIAIFTTSNNQRDVEAAYKGGAVSFFTKDLENLHDIALRIGKYWFFGPNRLPLGQNR